MSLCLVPMYISLHSLHSIMYTTFFELRLKILFILNLVSGFLIAIGFTFNNYITFFALFIFAYIYIYIGSISSLIQISLNITDILCLHIFFRVRSNSRIILSYRGGIDLCIFHSCMHPKYFLPDFGPSSREDLLRKGCNFCFSILPLCKSVFTVEDYGVSF